jgi:ABC-type sugar transport system substrate-binding protein
MRARCAAGVACALLLASLAACSRDTIGDQAYQYVIGVSLANLTEPWRINMSEEIKSEASHYANLRVVFTDAADSSNRQIQDVKKLLDCGIDLLIISPNDAEALTPVIAEAYRHIPVILLDRSVIGYDYTLYIGPDNRLIGKQAGQYVADLLGARGGKVVEILGRSGSPPTLDRKLGFREAIDKAGNVSIVGTIVADWLRDKAEDGLAAWLRSNGKPDVIFAQNDAMAYGAYRAALRLGITGMRFVGIDGLPGPHGGIDLVKNEVLTATVTCPTGGKEALIYAMDILHHETGIPKRMLLRTSLVTRQTLASGTLNTPPRPRREPGRKIVLGFAQVGKESEWRVANTESIKAAAREAGVELIFVDGEQRQENQIRAIRSFIAQKVDIIAFSPVVESGWGPVLREAKAARIPVILTDRAVDVKDESLWITFMGSDFVEEGRRSARWLADYLKKIGRDDGSRPINIVELQGTIGSAPAIDRTVGFLEVLKDHPNYHIIASESGDFFRSVGKDVMRQILRDLMARHQRFDAVFAHNDDMALGAIEAMEEAGLKPGTDIVVVSVDAARGAFKAMIAGKLNCTVECSPLLGPQLMKAVKDYESGKDLPVRIITAESVFPAEVAGTVLPYRKY